MSSSSPCSFNPANEDTPNGYSTDCPLGSWSGSSEGLCILHAQDPNKPHDEIQQALSEHSQPVVNASLTNIHDGSDLDFSQAKLPGADFSGSSLRGVNFEGALLKCGNFSNADLTDAEFGPNTTLISADFTNSTCNRTKFTKSNIQFSDFIEATIIDAHLSYTQGEHADFSGAELVSTKLFQSNLASADFIGANLRASSFRASDLSGSDFTDAKVRECDFIDAQLEDIQLANAAPDNANDFGTQLLSEYQADRLAEPSWVIDSFGLPRVETLGYGVNSERPRNEDVSERGLEDTPPESPFEGVFDKWWWPLYVHLLSIFRLVSRGLEQLRIRLDGLWGESNSDFSRQIKLLSQAEDTYSEIKSSYRGTAWSASARRFNILEKEARRKQINLFWPWLQDSVLYRSMRHGEDPRQVIKVAAFISMISTIVFLHYGIQTGNQTVIQLSGEFRLDLLADSIIFTVRRLFTFSDGNYKLLGGNSFATVVSIIGALLEAALIFTLGRRAVS